MRRVIMSTASAGFVLLLLWGVLPPVESEKPIQLLQPDSSHRSLVIVEESLQLLRKIPAPVSVISVVGSIHTGKSYFLNQLLGRSSGFKVGYGVEPQTAGLWLWSDPLKTADGVNVVVFDSEGFNAPRVSDLYDAKIFAIATLMSSELIYNTVKFIDSQFLDTLELLTRRANLFGLRAFARRNAIQAPVNLANASGDEGAEASLADLDAVQAESVGDLIEDLLPGGLTWVVQDFVQDLRGVQPLDWLLSLMDSPSSSPTSGGVGGTSFSLRSFFETVDCLALPHPTHSSEYLQKLDEAPPEALDQQYKKLISNYRERLFRRLSNFPKMRSARKQGTTGRPHLSGADLAELLRFLVDAANFGTSSDDNSPGSGGATGAEGGGEEDSAFPKVPSIWQSFARYQLDLIKNDLVQVFKVDAANALGLDPNFESPKGHLDVGRRIQDGKAPPGEDKIVEILEAAVEKVMKLWSTNTRGLGGATAPVSQVEQELQSLLSDTSNMLKKEACNRTVRYCRACAEDTLRVWDAKIIEKQATIPHPPDNINHWMKRGYEEARDSVHRAIDRQTGNAYRKSKCCTPAVEEALSRVDSFFEDLNALNNRAVDSAVRTAFEESKKTLTEALNLFRTQSVTGVSGGGGSLAGTDRASLDMSQSDFTELLSRLASEAQSHFTDQVGVLAGTKSVSNAAAELNNQIKQFRVAAEADWNRHCRQASAEIVRGAVIRMPITLRRRLPFPTTEESLAAAVAEHIQTATEELGDLGCSGSSPWKESLSAMLADLKEEAARLDQQNVQAVKELSSEPLSYVKSRLDVIAQNTYFWFTFRRSAESQAVEALQRASKAQGTDLSAALERKVVSIFLKEDLGPLFKLVSFNLYSSVALIAGAVGSFAIGIAHFKSSRPVRSVTALITGFFFAVDNSLRRWLLSALYVPFTVAYSACEMGGVPVSGGMGFNAKWATTLLLLHLLNFAILWTMLGNGLFSCNFLGFFKPDRSVSASIGAYAESAAGSQSPYRGRSGGNSTYRSSYGGGYQSQVNTAERRTPRHTYGGGHYEGRGGGGYTPSEGSQFWRHNDQ